MMRIRTHFRNVTLATTLLALAGCAGGSPEHFKGSVQDGTFVGQPTGNCEIEGDYIHAYFKGGRQVKRDVFKYTTIGKCGTKARPVGRCFTAVVISNRTYDRNGTYRGSYPVDTSAYSISCPNFIDFFPPGYAY